MWTNKYIAIPFAERGRNWTGSDCWGLVRLIYKQELKIELPSFLYYDNTDDRAVIGEMVKSNYKNWVKIPPGEEKEFDVLVFRMVGYPSHLGVVMGDGNMIHCERGSGTHVVNYRDDPHWSRRMVGIYRHVESPHIAPTIQ